MGRNFTVSWKRRGGMLLERQKGKGNNIRVMQRESHKYRNKKEKCEEEKDREGIIFVCKRSNILIIP